MGFVVCYLGAGVVGLGGQAPLTESHVVEASSVSPRGGGGYGDCQITKTDRGVATLLPGDLSGPGTPSVITERKGQCGKAGAGSQL